MLEGQAYATIRAHAKEMNNADPNNDRERDVIGFTVIAAFGAALSLAVTGYLFGISNNLFHLPIIQSLYDEPQFRTDAFMQSLRFYAAGPFLMLRGAANYISGPRLFLALDFLSRLLLYVGFLGCARLLGISSRRDRLIFTVLLTFTSFLQGTAFAGGNELFINSFNHTTITNGLSLIAIYYAARGRLIESFAFNGLVFFTSAFVAVWNIGPLGLVIGLLLLRRRISPAEVLKRGGIGLMIFLVLASPVIVNVLSNPDFGRPPPFNYREFLAEYWPYHFLFQEIPLRHKIALVVTLLTGTLAFFALAQRADVFLAALWGYVAVYAIGIVAPAMTGSAAILNLHLLRSSSGILLLSALGTVALATSWQASRDPLKSRVFGPLLIVTLCTVKPALVLAPMVIGTTSLHTTSRRLPSLLLQPGRAIQFVVAFVLLGLWPYTVWENWRENANLENHVAQWTAVGTWANRNTPPDAVFLILTADIRGLPIDTDWGRCRPRCAPTGEEVSFEYVSHRRIWVDFRRGAAAMWSPSYYPIWRGRIAAVLRLSSLDEKLAYAARHRVSYVVDWCSQSDTRPSVFRTEQLCVFNAIAPPSGTDAPV